MGAHLLRETAMLCWTEVETPIGPLRVTGDGESVSTLYMHQQRHRPPDDPVMRRDDALLAPVAAQLAEYFTGERRDFELSVRFGAGTEFQRRVWDALMAIPYGAVTTYGQLARQLGVPNASRAVGLANGKNPVSIIVPCHRVVGSGGALTGYGGGVDRKRWLLDHEQGRARLRP
jgi:methylated-DNA-[protein]-cysteine S-methyltransferase